MIIALPARAKLNLDLEVLGRREDGYHDLRTTYQAVDLHDLLVMAKAHETSLTTTGLEIGDHAADSGNTVLAAHAAFEDAAKRKLPTAFHLHKRIPPGSGLGGASSDAAATLRGLVQLYGLAIADISSIASRLGADVPFFLHGGTAVAEGRGDRLSPVPTQAGWFAVAWPSIELRTPDVYRAWDDTPGRPPNHLTRAAMSIEPRLEVFAGALEKVKSGWQMTGSGSAFFARCANQSEADQTIRRLDCWTAVAHTVGAWT